MHFSLCGIDFHCFFLFLHFFFRVVAKKRQQDHVLAQAVQLHPNKVLWLIVQKMVANQSIIKHCMKQPGKRYLIILITV